MKNFTFLLILLFGTIVVNGQTVSSTCTAPDSIVQKYIHDANRLALRKIKAQNLTYKDSILIPYSHSDTVLKALLAVYNATSLPARDTIVTLFNIHTFPIPNINCISISADSSLAWMHQLRNGIIPTGNSQVDSLLAYYYLNIDYYSDWAGWFIYHTVRLVSDSDYNALPLSNVFDSVAGVVITEACNVYGDGNDIYATIYTDHVELIYSLGGGDCPSGCTKRRYWKFNVYFDCTVQYVGSYGSPLYPPANAGLDRSICPGDSTSLGSISCSGCSYYWYPSDSLNNRYISNPIASPTVTTAYTVQVYSSTALLAANKSVTVTVYPLPIAFVTPSDTTTVCHDSTINISANSAVSYLWNTGETSQSILIENTGDYFVTVIDSNGCSASSLPVTIIVSIDSLLSVIVADSFMLSTDSTMSNQWYRNDTLIGGATNPTYTVPNPIDYYQCYTVIATNALGCSAKSDSVCFSPLTVTGYLESEYKYLFYLYPNPFSTQLTFSLADNEPTTVLLYNFLGQQVLQQTFTNSTTVNTAQLADGIYFYELRSNKGALKTGRVVKQ